MLSEARLSATRIRDFALRFTGHLPTNALRIALYRHGFGMRIASGAKIDTGSLVWGPGRITIGTGTVINRGVVLNGRFRFPLNREKRQHFAVCRDSHSGA